MFIPIALTSEPYAYASSSSTYPPFVFPRKSKRLLSNLKSGCEGLFDKLTEKVRLRYTCSPHLLGNKTLSGLARNGIDLDEIEPIGLFLEEKVNTYHTFTI